MRILESAIRIWWMLIRFGFRLLYNEMAWSYDLVSWTVSLGHWREWQNSVIPYIASEPVLELAHGTADLQLDMLEAGFAPIGLDFSPFMGRIARRKLNRARQKIRLVRADAMHLPFPSSWFSAIVSTFPTEFIVSPETVNEIIRVLEPGGRFILIPNAILTLSTPIARILEGLYQITGQRSPWPGNFLNIFEEAGLSITVNERILQGSKVWVVVGTKEESKG